MAAAVAAAAPTAGPDAGAFPGLAVAAQATVDDLQRRYPLDLWMVTHVSGDRQLVVAASGPWAAVASPGTVLPWAASFCRHVVAAGRAVAEPDVASSPELGPVAVGAYAPVRGYLGVPLLGSEDALFGTLCGFAGPPRGAGGRDLLTPALPAARLLARLLSTVVATEQVAADRSQDAARAYALAERDGLTGLRNPRGWVAALQVEQHRAARRPAPAALVTVDVLAARPDRPAPAEQVVAAAEVVRATCRPGDVLARTGSARLGVLALGCGRVGVEQLVQRLRAGLDAAAIPARVHGLTCDDGQDLEQGWQSLAGGEHGPAA